MKVFALVLGLLAYVFIVNNTHLIQLHRLFTGDDYEIAQAAISMGAFFLILVIHRLFKSTTPLYYFRGMNLTHIAVFIAATFITLTLLSIELDFVYLFVTVLVFAVIEQYIVFAQISYFYGRKHWSLVLITVYLIFMFGHGLTFNIQNVASTLFLLPTLYRTIVDRTIWHGVIFHYTYNVGIINGLEVDDPNTGLWLALLLLYWGLLIFTADNAKPTPAKILSWFFRGRIGIGIAALLTVLCRLPILLVGGTKRPVDEYFLIRDSLASQARVRAQTSPRRF